MFLIRMKLNQIYEKEMSQKTTLRVLSKIDGEKYKKIKKENKKICCRNVKKRTTHNKVTVAKEKKIDSISSESKKHDFSKLNSVLTTEKILKFEPSLRCVTELEHQR